MQDFIVLGLVPGTHYQVSFLFWLYLSAGLLLVTLIVLERHRLRAVWLGWRVARLINKYPRPIAG